MNDTEVAAKIAEIRKHHYNATNLPWTYKHRPEDISWLLAQLDLHIKRADDAEQPVVRCHSCKSTLIWKRELGEIQVFHNCGNVTELQGHLGNLLAIIHRDGGHHQTEVGTTKAVEDAIALLWADKQQLSEASTQAAAKDQGELASEMSEHQGEIDLAVELALKAERDQLSRDMVKLREAFVNNQTMNSNDTREAIAIIDSIIKPTEPQHTKVCLESVNNCGGQCLQGKPAEPKPEPLVQPTGGERDALGERGSANV